MKLGLCPTTTGALASNTCEYVPMRTFESSTCEYVLMRTLESNTYEDVITRLSLFIFEPCNYSFLYRLLGKCCLLKVK